MQEHHIQTLLKRGFQYTTKRQLDQSVIPMTGWNRQQILQVHKHRGDLLSAKQGLHRRNGDPSASHEQFIQVSLLLDGHHDYRTSCLAWSHDMRDDYMHFFKKFTIEQRYGTTLAKGIRSLSRSDEWITLPFREEIARSDKRIRAGGKRSMVIKILDRVHNDGHPLQITSEKRRRKSGMKLWQTYNSIIPFTQELGYMENELLWLANRQLKRLRYSAVTLDKLVEQPLHKP